MVYYRQNALSYALEIIFHCISNKLFLREVNLGRDLKEYPHFQSKNENQVRFVQLLT